MDGNKLIAGVASDLFYSLDFVCSWDGACIDDDCMHGWVAAPRSVIFLCVCAVVEQVVVKWRCSREGMLKGRCSREGMLKGRCNAWIGVYGILCFREMGGGGILLWRGTKMSFSLVEGFGRREL